MLKAILIDDEKSGRESLRKKLQTHCPQVEVIAECGNGQEGLIAISQFTPDIVFLDIEMPLMNGFTMLQQLPRQNFDLVFTTAFNQYAINAIRFSALDYLVKPIDVQELVNAVQRIAEKQQSHQPFSNEQLAILGHYISQQKSTPDKIAVSTAAGLEILEFAHIIYLEAEGNYTNIHLDNSRPLLSSKTLKEFEDILPPQQFCRIHNGSLVNISFVKRYNKGEGGQVVLHNGTLLDVARRRKDDLLILLSTIAKKV